MGLDLEALKKSLLERGVTSQNAYNPSQAAEVLALIEELAEARAQLPEGMKHCTILFKECEKGHGWLTATNWVQHGCPHCDLAHARAAALKEADRHLRQHDSALADVMDLEGLSATPATVACVPVEVLAERVRAGHNDTCGAVLSSEPYPCSCGHAALAEMAKVTP